MLFSSRWVASWFWRVGTIGEIGCPETAVGYPAHCSNSAPAGLCAGDTHILGWCLCSPIRRLFVAGLLKDIGQHLAGVTVLDLGQSSDQLINVRRVGS